MNNRNKALLIFGLGLVVIFITVSYLRKDSPRLQLVTGQTMGTIVYNVKVIAPPITGLKAEIDQVLWDLNQSLSTYIPESDISQLNREGHLLLESSYFVDVLNASKLVYDKTNGSFDPTIGPLVMAWGFGPDKTVPDLDSAEVDSLKSLTGFDKVLFDERQITLPENFQLDFSAIAKGYAVDLVADILEKRGIGDYLVEIGGEVRCKGYNEEGKSWSLGIEDPTVQKNEQKLLAIVRLKDKSLATSGNYRNYYQKNGRTYAHIINPVTGYTATHNLLSASVFAENCMLADAYATAFMVLGVEGSKKIIAKENIDAILIFQNDTGKLESFVSEGISSFVELNRAK